MLIIPSKFEQTTCLRLFAVLAQSAPLCLDIILLWWFEAITMWLQIHFQTFGKWNCGKRVAVCPLCAGIQQPISRFLALFWILFLTMSVLFSCCFWKKIFSCCVIIGESWAQFQRSIGQNILCSDFQDIDWCYSNWVLLFQKWFFQGQHAISFQLRGSRPCVIYLQQFHTRLPISCSLFNDNIYGLFHAKLYTFSLHMSDFF